MWKSKKKENSAVFTWQKQLFAWFFSTSRWHCVLFRFSCPFLLLEMRIDKVLFFEERCWLSAYKHIECKSCIIIIAIITVEKDGSITISFRTNQVINQKKANFFNNDALQKEQHLQTNTHTRKLIEMVTIMAYALLRFWLTLIFPFRHLKHHWECSSWSLQFLDVCIF